MWLQTLNRRWFVEPRVLNVVVSHQIRFCLSWTPWRRCLLQTARLAHLHVAHPTRSKILPGHSLLQVFAAHVCSARLPKTRHCCIHPLGRLLLPPPSQQQKIPHPTKQHPTFVWLPSDWDEAVQLFCSDGASRRLQPQRRFCA